MSFRTISPVIGQCGPRGRREPIKRRAVRYSAAVQDVFEVCGRGLVGGRHSDIVEAR